MVSVTSASRYIKVDPRCKSEVWLHGIGRGSSDCCQLLDVGATRYICIVFKVKEKVNEYNQEVPQSYTADQPMAPAGRDTEYQQSHDIKSNKGKAISSHFLREMIAKLETTLHAHVRIDVHARIVQRNKVHIPIPQNNGGNNKQWIDNNRTTALERTAAVTSVLEMGNNHFQNIN